MGIHEVIEELKAGNRILETENKRLKAMYDAAKGDLEDSLRGHDELAEEFAKLQAEIEMLTKGKKKSANRKNS